MLGEQKSVNDIGDKIEVLTDRLLIIVILGGYNAQRRSARL